jgi:hypothetical protein
VHDKGASVHDHPVPENAVAVNPAGSVSLTVTAPAVGLDPTFDAVSV